jgi:hypothetical protein
MNVGNAGIDGQDGDVRKNSLHEAQPLCGSLRWRPLNQIDLNKWLNT